MQFIDQINRTIRLEQKPSRIVSLVPSQTQYLHFLKMEDRVVGITKFCIHPKEWFLTKERVGGTKNVNVEKVKALKPDLIIANKEENTLSDIEQLMPVAPVWISDVNTKEDAFNMMLSIGEMVGELEEATAIVDRIKSQLSAFQNIKEQFSFLYFMWKDPYFTVGKETFIDSWLSEFGGVNLQEKTRYPEYDFTEKHIPDVVLISTEPFPFSKEHFSFFQEKFQQSKIVLVDGEMASWYGNKMEEATTYFLNLLYSKSQ